MKISKSAKHIALGLLLFSAGTIGMMLLGDIKVLFYLSIAVTIAGAIVLIKENFIF
jgi:hypothetical protein